MKLILNGQDFIHLPDQSCYNNNYYKHKETGIIIFEHCDELYGVNTYTDVTDPNSQYFLGCSSCANGEGIGCDEKVEVEFKINY